MADTVRTDSVLPSKSKDPLLVQNFGSPGAKGGSHHEMIADRFQTLNDVTAALKGNGMDKCGLIFGIDYTLRNKKQGATTFHGLSLHDTTREKLNPYQEKFVEDKNDMGAYLQLTEGGFRVICILGETLASFDDDGMIPVYGFGDSKVKDKGVFPLKDKGECDGFEDVLSVYKEITPKVKLEGPTNFAPVIDEAIRIVKEKKQEDTIRAITKASEFPMSIVVIGVGDGPWDTMYDFDDKLPARQFDNFQFVDFHKVKSATRNPGAAVALAALLEIPDQYLYIRENKLVDKMK